MNLSADKKIVKNNLSILLIIPDYKYHEGNPFFPVGILYVISIIEQAGYDVDILNLNLLSGSTEELVSSKLKEKRYNVVCIGGSIFDLSEIKNIFSVVKQFDNKITTILGGRIILYDSEILFHEFDADYGVIGDADITLPALLEKISYNSADIVENTIYKESGQIKVAPFSHNKQNIDSIPYPNIIKSGYEKVLPAETADIPAYEHFIEKGWKSYSIMSGFNCTNNCTFCANSHQSYRKRTEQSLFREMDYALKHYDVDVFNFISDIYSSNWDDIERLCNEIQALKIKYKKSLYFVIYMKARGFTIDKAKLLKEAGCIGVFFGFESYDNDVLKSMRKGITTTDIDTAIHACRSINLTYRSIFIFGDVNETKNSYKRTLDYWKKNGRGFMRISPIVLFPGTKLMDYAIEHGIVKDKMEYYRQLSNNESYILLARNLSSYLNQKEYRKMLNTILSYSIKYKLYNKCTSIEQNEENKLYKVQYTCLCCSEKNKRENVNLNKRAFTMLTCAHCGARNCLHILPNWLVFSGVNVISFFAYHFGIQMMKILRKMNLKTPVA